MKDSLFSGFALSALIHAALIPYGFAPHRWHQADETNAEYRGFLDRHPQIRANAGTGA